MCCSGWSKTEELGFSGRGEQRLDGENLNWGSHTLSWGSRPQIAVGGVGEDRQARPPLQEPALMVWLGLLTFSLFSHVGRKWCLQKGSVVFNQTPRLSSAGVTGEVLRQGLINMLDGASAVCAEPPQLVGGLESRVKPGLIPEGPDYLHRETEC